jgi:hypothetical protein
MLWVIRLSCALGLALGLASGAAHAADSRDLGDIEPADSRDVGDPEAPGAGESAASWQPPACEPGAEASAELPPAADAAGWSNLLADARTRADKARARLAAADSAYSHARNRQRPRGEALQEIVGERDAARSEYARARCALPDLVEKARRAGVAPEVWRGYPASLD